MLKFTANTTINSTPETIWRIITDAPSYTDWDANMIRLDGTIAPGEQLTIYTKLDPKRAFKPKVVEFTPNRKMVWQSGMPFGLFTGARTFLLEPQGNSVCFTLTEEFKGAMLPMIRGSIPDLTPTFQTFVQALKERAEAASS
jgi:hypothetical protein